MNLETLLDKAKWSTLSENEVRSVAQKINEFDKSGDYSSLYSALHILGRAEAHEYKALIEKFLVYPKDPMVSRIALKVLCEYWDFIESYKGHLMSFIKGINWDKEEQVRIVAISIAGEYVRKTKNKEFLRLLLNTFENEKEERMIRMCVYSALLRILGLDWNQIPQPRELFSSLEEYIDPSLINQFHKLL